MKIHHYHRDTGAYLFSEDARPDPLEYELLCEDARRFQTLAKNAKIKDLREQRPITDDEFAPPIPQKFLVPKYATMIAPPEIPGGAFAIFSNEKWSLIDEAKVEEPA